MPLAKEAKTRIYAICGNVFETRHSREKYCSKECAKSGQKLIKSEGETKKRCRVCLQEFVGRERSRCICEKESCKAIGKKHYGSVQGIANAITKGMNEKQKIREMNRRTKILGMPINCGVNTVSQLTEADKMRIQVFMEDDPSTNLDFLMECCDCYDANKVAKEMKKYIKKV